MVGEYDRFDIRFTMIPTNGNYPSRAGWYYSDGTPVPDGPPSFGKTGVILGSMDWIFPEMEENYYDLVNSSRSDVDCIVSITSIYPDKHQDVSGYESEEAMEILDEIARIGENRGYAFEWDSDLLYDFALVNSVQMFFE